MTPALLRAAPRLRWLQSPTISLESVLFPELASSDVVVTNMRNIYNDHIANHVLALFLALCRDLPRMMRRQRERDWVFQADVKDPAAMTILVMGLGGIGAEVCRRLAILAPAIVGVDPKVSAPPAGVREVHKPERLPELLPQADATIVCAPQTPETTGLFDETLFSKMKRSAFFINIGRGKIVKLAALEKALAECWIAGAGLD
ncbi:MAG: D-2-hydroxyacid dehydrogenase, partial [Candidatus Eremiobacteraeota bacterium]|nr:D-2-hydroxyacid dehydrogenase [Candidatus Eremiobacteraeota bacterium]